MMNTKTRRDHPLRLQLRADPLLTMLIILKIATLQLITDQRKAIIIGPKKKIVLLHLYISQEYSGDLCTPKGKITLTHH
jgi:hypothetical protein